ncbi:MAG TPA: FMN-binding protein [Candidatus Polarisedimenticolaceae bacterium]
MTSSARPVPAMQAPRRRPLTAFVMAALLAVAGRAEAKAFLSQEQALRLAFGEGAASEKKTAYLTQAQLARARELAGPGVEVSSALVTRYEGRRDGASLGFAYFDTHVVRTLPETLMVVVGPDGAIVRVDVVVFSEPEDYLPRDAWFGQFRGRRLERELSVKRGIHGITGATLSAQAATDAARRILAVHQALAESPGTAR